MARVTIKPAAEADVINSALWLDEKEAGLGERLSAEVRASVARLAQHPESGPEVEGGCRRLLVRRFHHGIFYRIHDGEVEILAIVDLRRDPRDIARLLTDRP